VNKKNIVWIIGIMVLLVASVTAIEKKFVYPDYEETCEKGIRDVWKEANQTIYATCDVGNLSCVEGKVILKRSYNYKTTEEYCKETKKLIFGKGKEIVTDKEGCYVVNDIVTCINKKNGYAKNRNKKYWDKCRSGEDCYQYKISEWRKIE